MPSWCSEILKVTKFSWKRVIITSRVFPHHGLLKDTCNERSDGTFEIFPMGLPSTHKPSENHHAPQQFVVQWKVIRVQNLCELWFFSRVKYFQQRNNAPHLALTFQPLLHCSYFASNTSWRLLWRKGYHSSSRQCSALETEASAALSIKLRTHHSEVWHGMNSAALLRQHMLAFYYALTKNLIVFEHLHLKSSLNQKINEIIKEIHLLILFTNFYKMYIKSTGQCLLGGSWALPLHKELGCLGREVRY